MKQPRCSGLSWCYFSFSFSKSLVFGQMVALNKIDAWENWYLKRLRPTNVDPTRRWKFFITKRKCLSFLGRVSHTIHAYKLQVLQKVDRFCLFVLRNSHLNKKTPYHVCKMKTFHITSLIPQAAKIPDVPHWCFRFIASCNLCFDSM